VVPKGTPADVKAYLAATIQAAVANQELIAEYQKLGAYFDDGLLKSKTIAADLNVLSQKERDFYVKTGRLKP
jgi:tripartite-type tricarboxylate transporter receptor subunit TctC